MYLDADGKVKTPACTAIWQRACRAPCWGWKPRVKYGKLSREQVLAPAIRLAREGFVLTRADTDILDTTVARFKQDPESAKIFLRPDGSPLQPGTNWCKPIWPIRWKPSPKGNRRLL